MEPEGAAQGTSISSSQEPGSSVSTKAWLEEAVIILYKNDLKG